MLFRSSMTGLLGFSFWFYSFLYPSIYIINNRKEEKRSFIIYLSIFQIGVTCIFLIYALSADIFKHMRMMAMYWYFTALTFTYITQKSTKYLGTSGR